MAGPVKQARQANKIAYLKAKQDRKQVRINASQQRKGDLLKNRQGRKNLRTQEGRGFQLGQQGLGLGKTLIEETGATLREGARNADKIAGAAAMFV